MSTIEQSKATVTYDSVRHDKRYQNLLGTEDYKLVGSNMENSVVTENYVMDRDLVDHFRGYAEEKLRFNRARGVRIVIETSTPNGVMRSFVDTRTRAANIYSVRRDQVFVQQKKIRFSPDEMEIC